MFLQHYSSIKTPYAVVNPIRFEQPVAPHIAANATKSKLSKKLICQAIVSSIQNEADVNLIEGVGGWAVPLNDTELLSDVIIELEYWVLKDNQKVCVNLSFSSNQRGIFQTFDDYVKKDWENQEGLKKGLYSSRCTIRKNNFNEGIVDINLAIFIPPGDIDSSYQVMLPKKATGILSFNIVDNKSLNSVRGTYPYAWHKDLVFRPECKWSYTKLDNFVIYCHSY